jgi:hypothetical protein
MTIYTYAECHYAESLLYNIMPNVIMLSVVMLSVTNNTIMLNVIMLRVGMWTVVTPDSMGRLLARRANIRMEVETP